MTRGKRALEAIAEAMADRRERERLQREERGRSAAVPKENRPATAKDVVTEHTRQHGQYEDGFMPDLSVQNMGKPRMVKVIRNLYPHIVDRWLAEGGPGFGDPQRAAIEHCRGLWHKLGTQGRLVANLDGVGGGRGALDRVLEHSEAHCELVGYRDRLGMPWLWSVFESVVRDDMPAGKAGSHLASTTSQQQAHAKAATGFVASMIAQWRGF